MAGQKETDAGEQAFHRTQAIKQAERQKKLRSYKQTFLNDVSELLKPHNSAGTKVLNHLQMVGMKLNIRDLNVRAVINEATLRGLNRIDKTEEPIRSAAAWIRIVGHIILKGHVRDEIRSRALRLKQEIYPSSESSDLWDNSISEEQRKAVGEAIKLLSLEDQMILNLRFLKGMNYTEIQKYYLAETQSHIELSALRKRESRAVKRLKTKFEEIYE
jgi:DNA-directed RNA polymerase specialized sigma24 family protein